MARRLSRLRCRRRGVALDIHTVEAVVHGWDLAVATGQPATIDAELCEVAWQHAQLVDDTLRGPGRAFGAAVPIAGSATPTDQLVAWLGVHPPAMV